MDVEKFKKDLGELDNKIDKLIEKKKSLLLTCTHPDVKIFKEYSEGGYDYFSSTYHKSVCLVCAKTLETRIEQHSWR